MLLGLLTVFRVLDLGFHEALNRPFDPVIDWSYLDSAVGLVDDSLGRPAAVAALVGAALLTAGAPGADAAGPAAADPDPACPPAHVLPGRRRPGVLWLASASVGAHAGDGEPLASTSTATYAYGQVARIPAELRDQRAFARAAEQDPLRSVPAADLLTGLRGKDVLLVFVESYGRSRSQGSSFSPGINRVLDDGTRRLQAHGVSPPAAPS